MAYDRTERFPKIITQTPPKIGPGTYDISDLPPLERHLVDFHPFLSGSKRRTITIPRDAERLPGPGTYDIKELQRHIPERSFQNLNRPKLNLDKKPRFKEKISEGPGPLDYHVATDFIKLRKIRSDPGTRRGPAGKLWLTRPPRSIVPTAASIPDKNYTGYSINQYGSLVKNPLLRKTSTFFYNVSREETNTTTLLYKGNFWSRMTGRKEVRPFLTPGPGDYEHETKKTAAQIYDEKIREERRMTSRQSRFLDTLCRRKTSENFPAPNAYNIKGNFDKFFRIDCKCDSHVTVPPPFGQTAKRFEDKMKSDVPGPGTYDPPVQIKCTGSIYPAPFGTCAGRFQKVSEDIRPGPSDYHLRVGNLAYESEKRCRYTYLRQTHPRRYFETISSYQDQEDYDDVCSPEKTEEKKCAVYHAAFKSKTKRFLEIRKKAPDPGAYDVLTAFRANRDKCDFLCPRLAPPFGTRSSRLPKSPRDVKDMPDPTYYNLATDISENVKGGVIPESEKIEEISLAPPATRYCVSFLLSYERRINQAVSD
ncbi:hypothetical protein K0M31_004499 [Melipona bicolor]|uniref:Sperm-tail PG-rich repeat-containing protein 2 n=1 Tax=Melipona bicolor TaxID=60889 RepID=A0AA40FWX3_9HYME|nr:hypothetical protein K0M31_004499 [Melipona bicolor]